MPFHILMLKLNRAVCEGKHKHFICDIYNHNLCVIESLPCSQLHALTRLGVCGSQHCSLIQNLSSTPPPSPKASLRPVVSSLPQSIVGFSQPTSLHLWGAYLLWSFLRLMPGYSSKFPLWKHLWDKMETLGRCERHFTAKPQTTFPFVLCLHFLVLKVVPRPLWPLRCAAPFRAPCLYSSCSVCNTLPSSPASETYSFFKAHPKRHLLFQSPPGTISPKIRW